MKPGIYDISSNEYHKSNGISRSGIMLLKKSPRHFWHKYINNSGILDSDTPAKLFGKAVHTAIIEPDKFFDEYCVIPKLDRRKTEDKKIYEAFCAANIGKAIISEEDQDKINKIHKSVSSSFIPDELIKGGQYEKSIFWIDSDTGVLCKARPDILHVNMFVDLKTTCDGSFYAFQRDLYEYGYHIQAAMIQDAVKAVLNKTIEDFIFIAIEKEEPFVESVYQLDSSAIERGREEYKKYLQVYKDCLSKNLWPGYPIERVSLPKYAA